MLCVVARPHAPNLLPLTDLLAPSVRACAPAPCAVPLQLLAEPLATPPVSVRARLFAYNFTRWGDSESAGGAWYRRAFVRDYFPPLRRGVKLTNLMRSLPSA